MDDLFGDILKFDEIDKLIVEDLFDTNYFQEVKFDFIKDHNGFKNGKVHLLIGTMGSGKTTLAQSILTMIATKKRVCYYSSESDENEFKYNLYKFGIPETSQIAFINEDSIGRSYTNFNKQLNHIRDVIKRTDSKILFYDNLTTSGYYAANTPGMQIKYFNDLSNLCVELNIPFFIIAHTHAGIKEVNQNLVDGDNIRGSKIPSIKSQYIYTYTRPHISEDNISVPNGVHEYFLPFIHVAKARVGDNSNACYILKFNQEKKQYIEDKKTSVSVIKSILRNAVRIK